MLYVVAINAFKSLLKSDNSLHVKSIKVVSDNSSELSSYYVSIDL